MRVGIVALALLLLGPGAAPMSLAQSGPVEPEPLPPSGTWGNGLNQEPNTDYDYWPWMWNEPDTVPTTSPTRERVYLDVVVYQRETGDLATPMTGSPAVVYQAFAYFGLWKDCNNDGMIGDGKSGLIDYPADELIYLYGGVFDSLPPEVAPGSEICPRPAASGLYARAHNDGVTVRELLWLVPPDVTPEVGEVRSSGQSLLWADVEPGPYERAAGQIYPLPEDPGAAAEALARYADNTLGNPLDTTPLPGAKTAPDLEFHYNAAPAIGVPDPIHAQGRASPDPARGWGATACLAGNCRGWYSSPFVIVAPTVDTGLDAILYGQPARPDVRPREGSYITAYTLVTPATISAQNVAIPSSHYGTYGADACGTHTSGIWGGWDCDALNWAGPVDVGWPVNMVDTDWLQYVRQAATVDPTRPPA